MRLVVHALAALGLAALLAGCVSRPVQQQVPVDQGLARQHDQARAAVDDWRIAGRLAVSNGSEGGSGRIDWQQRAGRYSISLGAPITRQSWQLTGDATGARLDGIKGGPREGSDVEALLMEATGWEIPVRAMVDWVRGIGAEAREFGPARVVHGAGDVPTTLEQAGWRIEYRDWHPATAALPALPRRIEAQRGDARVRLVVDEWHTGQE